MKISRQVLVGVLVAVLSVIILIGSFVLSMSERNETETPLPTQDLTATPTSTMTSATSPSAHGTTQETEEVSTPTPAEVEVDGETSFQSFFPGAFYDAEELSIESTVEDQTEEPTPTPTEETKQVKSKKCKKPNGWIMITIRPGESLTRLSHMTGVSVSRLKKANCMGASNKLKVGKKFYIPARPFVPQPRFLPPFVPQYWPPQSEGAPQPTQPIIIITKPPESPSAYLLIDTSSPTTIGSSAGNPPMNVPHF